MVIIARFADKQLMNWKSLSALYSSTLLATCLPSTHASSVLPGLYFSNQAILQSSFLKANGHAMLHPHGCLSSQASLCSSCYRSTATEYSIMFLMLLRHLLFSIHLHTFIFIIYTIIVSLHLLLNEVPVFVSLIFIGSIPVYFIVALKRFYGQNIIKVILKFLGISMMYGILFWIIVGGVFLRALSIV